MLTGLTLDVTRLAVSIGNCSGEVTITRNHDEGHICLGASDHVFDEIAVTWSINDSEMPFLAVELLWGVCNVHTSLTLLFLAIHVDSKCERRLAQTIGLSLLVQFVFGDDTKPAEVMDLPLGTNEALRGALCQQAASQWMQVYSHRDHGVSLPHALQVARLG